jgi:hypothetical protein
VPGCPHVRQLDPTHTCVGPGHMFESPAVHPHAPASTPARHVPGSLVHTPTAEPLAHDQHALAKELPMTVQCAQSGTQNPFDPPPAAKGQKRAPTPQPAQERTVHVSPQQAPPQLSALQALEASCAASDSLSPPASGGATSDIASCGPTSATASLETLASSDASAVGDRPLLDKPHAADITDTAIHHEAPTRMSCLRRCSGTTNYLPLHRRAAQGLRPRSNRRARYSELEW